MTDTMRILVADDEPGMRSGVVRALRGFRVTLPDVEDAVHFEVQEAESGEDAMAKIAAAAPDILLLDYKLPGISGLDVLDRLAAAKSDVLVIMITAYASLETAVSAVKRGAYDFLAKPFTPEELKIAVRKAAGRLILAQQARRLAQEKRQVRFQLISVLAHELKAPLAAVEGYLRIMKDHAAGDDPAVYERMIDRSLLRTEGMRKLIIDLLDMTRIESGQKPREAADLDVCDVARAAIETVTPEAMQRKITVNLDAPAPVRMMADRGEIEIVLNNLVSNAVKYNRDGGRVDVAVRGGPGAVTIAVTDTGIGMTLEDAGRLFQEFVRIKNEQTRNILGSGLGLSIVKKVAVLYGGDVTVRSQPGVGSTFTVVLKPIAAAGGQGGGAGAPPARPAGEATV
ncbi:MAG: hybrid sensor histidine kinase/response regulator [Planctomycetota bacterium]|nr:hybrid sensor histidine kinase/response regulator [Planctomycetota bacterium]